MNLEWYESFRVTAGEKSFVRASEKLHISQPALTKQMRRLEDFYGVDLFHRSSSGIELTVEGQLFFQRIERILDDLRTLRSDLMDKGGTRVIQFGALPSVASFELPSRIFDWSQHGVPAAIALTGPTHKLKEALRSGQIDAAVMEHSGLHESAWAVVTTFFRPFYCICPADHRYADRERISVDDLRTEPLILHPEGCEVREAIVRAFRRRRTEPVVAYEAPFGEAIFGFVLAGAGIAIVPKDVADYIGDRKLHKLQIEDFPPRELAVVARSRMIANLLKGVLSRTPHVESSVQVR